MYSLKHALRFKRRRNPYPLQEDGTPFPTTAEARRLNDIAAEEYHDKIEASLSFRKLIPFLREWRD